MKKELSLEKKIYLCKYHKLDTYGLSKKEVNEILIELMKKGLYEKYKNMPEEEYERVIKNEKRQMKNKREERKMPSNNLMGLNDILFDQLRKLNSDTLSQDELNDEIRISKQVVSVSQTIINNANLLLQSKKYFDKTNTANSEIAPLLSLEGNQNEKNI